MKKKDYCPACGNRELNNLFITTNKGKSLSLMMSSQSDIRKSSGEVCCAICKQVWNIKQIIS
jgi:uncharacterized protein YbaR (Trm112 family)